MKLQKINHQFSFLSFIKTYSQRIALYLLLLTVLVDWLYIRSITDKISTIQNKLDQPHSVTTTIDPYDMSKQLSTNEATLLLTQVSQLLTQFKLQTTEISWINNEQGHNNRSLLPRYLNINIQGDYNHLEQFITQLLGKYPKSKIQLLDIAQIAHQPTLMTNLQISFL